MAKDYYATLEVPKNADEKQIKTAYRRLARKFHPDVNPNDKSAEGKFKEVSEAYEVLSDPEKRKLYDQFGSNWEAVKNAGGVPPQEGQGYDFQFEGGIGDIFGNLFGNFGGQPRQEVRMRGTEAANVERTVEVSLEEIDSGTKRTLTYQTNDACKGCDGTGFVQTRSTHTCPVCEGSGHVRGMFGMSTLCEACGGSGMSTLERCPTCRGSGTVPTMKRVEVTIPAGIQDGKKLRVPGKGIVGSNGKAGDLFLLVKEIPHKKFRRKGDDLEVDVSVPFATAALGGETRVESLNGPVKMKIPEYTQTGQTFRLAGKGLSKMNGGKGNLLAKITISVPKKLTEKQRQLLKEFAETEGVPA